MLSDASGWGPKKKRRCGSTDDQQSEHSIKPKQEVAATQIKTSGTRDGHGRTGSGLSACVCVQGIKTALY